MKHAFLRSLVEFFVLAAVGALLFFSYQALRRADLTMPVLFPPSSDNRPVISMDGFRLVQSDEGRVSWSVDASQANLLENKQAQLKDVEALFRNPDGRTAALMGELGTMDTASGNATIRRGSKDVRIVTSDGYLMTTDSLSWNARDRIVRTKDPFKVLGKEIYIEGKGMTASVDLGKLTVDENVKAILQE